MKNRTGPKFLYAIKEKQTGFSLIELMIAVAIIGVLLKIAIPAYYTSIQKSYRTDAKTALLDLASREEKYFSINNKYTATLSDIYPGVTGSTLAVQSGSSSYYTISIDSSSSITASTTAVAAFSATAQPTGSQATDACGAFTINSVGVTGNTAASASGAPSTVQTTGCW